MKRIALVFGLILSLVAFKANAGETPTNADKAHSTAVQMTKLLSLTPEQQTEVEALFLSKMNAIDAIKADDKKDGAAKEAAIAEEKKDREVKLQEILTPNQYTTYQDLKEQRKERAAATGVK